MKKTTRIVLLVSLICLLLCACTDPGNEQQNEVVQTLPALQTEIRPNTGDHDPDGQNLPTGQAEFTTDAPTNTATPETTEQNSLPETAASSESARTEETETEYVSDFVIDGGDSFFIGGN